MPSNSSNPILGSQVDAYVADARFHKTLVVPATLEHDALTVSYSDVGAVAQAPSDDAQFPTVLFMPGMFGSRYIGVAMHRIAEKLGVRVLVVDRPGMGHSTDVPVEKRVSVWIEIVPCLLNHLGIKHVALMSHSAGTIYLLNTLSQCRDILHPRHPFAALLAPWVDPVHSHVTTMQISQYVPSGLFSAWDSIIRFSLLHAAPVVGSSVASVTNVINVVSSGMAAGSESSEQAKNRRKIEENYGLSTEFQTELTKRIFKSMFGENTTGANSEALQCLKKGPSGSWGKCEDYAEFVIELVQNERRRSEGREGRARLMVRAYFAEDDSMIGKKGQQYFEECWRGRGADDFRDVLDFDAVTIPGSDHNTVVESVDVLEKVFAQALAGQ